MFVSESAAHPAVASLAQSAYDQLLTGEEIDYRVLSDLVAQASGKGVLRAIRRKYSQAAFDAMVMPILREIGQRAPVPPRRAPVVTPPAEDPLTASVWPPR